MKNKKRERNFALKLMCSLLALLMCAMCFISCNKDSDTTSTNTTPTGTTTAPSPDLPPEPPVEPPIEDTAEAIQLVSEGKANVRVVYQTMGGSFVTEASAIVRDALEELGGVEVSIVSDMLSSQNAEDLEIVIGDTTYADSNEAMSALEPNSYSVTISGNKIVVVANNVCLYPAAAEELVNAISAAEGAVTLAKDFSKKSESYPVVSLAANKKSDYTIIYANGDADAQAQATVLKDAFLAATGVNIPVFADTKSASGKEILIGNTNREVSEDSKAYYLNTCVGCEENGNLVITCGKPGNLNLGVERIVKCMEAISYVTSKINIPQTFFGSVAPEGYGTMPKYEGSGTVNLIESLDISKAYYVQVDGATKRDYEEYADKLEASGFSLYYSTKAQDSRFSTYTDGENIVNLSYIEYLDPLYETEMVTYINIAVDCIGEKGALPPLEASGEKITDVQVTMINAENAFIIRLEDGRFIVVDGGSYNNWGMVRDNPAEIYNQLVAQNVREGKPVVAAWIFTHSHGDHMNAYYSFTLSTKDFVDVQMVICNLQREELQAPVDYARRIINCTAAAYPDAKIVTAHAGQRFVFDGVVLDVLFTYENIFKIENDTNYSVIYSLDMPEGRMIILGDHQRNGCKLLNAIYAEDLECDVVQFCHHGMNGGYIGMYESMNAKVGLWTMPLERCIEKYVYDRFDYNHIDVRAYELHLVMSNTEGAMVLRADTTAEDLLQFRKFETLYGDKG